MLNHFSCWIKTFVLSCQPAFGNLPALSFSAPDAEKSSFEHQSFSGIICRQSCSILRVNRSGATSLLVELDIVVDQIHHCSAVSVLYSAKPRQQLPTVFPVRESLELCGSSRPKQVTSALTLAFASNSLSTKEGDLSFWHCIVSYYIILYNVILYYCIVQYIRLS